MNTISGIFFMLGGVVCLIVTLVYQRKVKAFETDGATCLATVKDIKKGSVYVNGKRRTNYSLVLTYVINGVSYTNELASSEAETMDAIGKNIEIRYRKEDPNKILSMDGEQIKRNVKVFYFMTAFLIILGIYMMIK